MLFPYYLDWFSEVEFRLEVTIVPSIFTKYKVEKALRVQICSHSNFKIPDVYYIIFIRFCWIGTSFVSLKKSIFVVERNFSFIIHATSHTAFPSTYMYCVWMKEKGYLQFYCVIFPETSTPICAVTLIYLFCDVLYWFYIAYCGTYLSKVKYLR